MKYYHYTKKVIINSNSNAQHLGSVVSTLACLGSITFAFFGNSTKPDHSLTCQCESKAKSKKDNDEEMFLGYFPKSQLFQPKRPYPSWDDNWDNKVNKLGEKSTTNNDYGVTRHVILIR